MQFVLGAAGEPREPGDGAIVISHTASPPSRGGSRARRSTARPRRSRSRASGARWPEAIETGPEGALAHLHASPTSRTLAVLALIAGELGPRARPRGGRAAADAVEHDADPGRAVPDPSACSCSPASARVAVTAREGALKLREAARLLAEGYDAEFLLHGSAVPLDARDALVLLQPSRDRTGSWRGSAGGARPRGGLAAVDGPTPGRRCSPRSRSPRGCSCSPSSRARGAARSGQVITGAWEADGSGRGASIRGKQSAGRCRREGIARARANTHLRDAHGQGHRLHQPEGRGRQDHHHPQPRRRVRGAGPPGALRGPRSAGQPHDEPGHRPRLARGLDVRRARARALDPRGDPQARGGRGLRLDRPRRRRDRDVHDDRPRARAEEGPRADPRGLRLHLHRHAAEPRAAHDQRPDGLPEGDRPRAMRVSVHARADPAPEHALDGA